MCKTTVPYEQADANMGHRIERQVLRTRIRRIIREFEKVKRELEDYSWQQVAEELLR